MTPNVLIIGPHKTGTSWIYAYLRRHPQVCTTTTVKEIFFFDKYAHRGTQWYIDHFNADESATVVVDVAPSYFADPYVPGRVAAILDNPLIIYIYRHPVERVWSYYLHLRRRGYTRQGVEATLTAQPHVLDASMYEHQVARWKHALPGSNIVRLEFSSLVEDAAAFAEQLCAMLGIDQYPVTPGLEESRNSATVAPNHYLAVVGRRVSDSLRHYGLYPVVNAAKSLGLKPIFFGGTTDANQLTPTLDELACIQSMLDARRRDTSVQHPGW